MNMLLYPGGLKAYSEIECRTARSVQERFIEQCAVMKYTNTNGDFEKLPSVVDEELGSDIVNMIDSVRVFEKTHKTIILHAYFRTKAARVSAIRRMAKRQSNMSGFKLLPMLTSTTRYSVYSVKLPLDSPFNAVQELHKALLCKNHTIVDILLDTDEVFNKYNGTATLILHERFSRISIAPYGISQCTDSLSRHTFLCLYCKRCKFLNDHETDYCPNQPEKAEEQPQKADDQLGNADDQPGEAEEKQGEAEEQQGKAEEQQGKAEEQQGKAEEQQGKAEEQQGKADDQPGAVDEQSEEEFEKIDNSDSNSDGVRGN